MVKMCINKKKFLPLLSPALCQRRLNELIIVLYYGTQYMHTLKNLSVHSAVWKNYILLGTLWARDPTTPS
jgi:hypothetical protein